MARPGVRGASRGGSRTAPTLLARARALGFLRRAPTRGAPTAYRAAARSPVPRSRRRHSPASLSAVGGRRLKEFPAVRCGRARLSRKDPSPGGAGPPPSPPRGRGLKDGKNATSTVGGGHKNRALAHGYSIQTPSGFRQPPRTPWALWCNLVCGAAAFSGHALACPYRSAVRDRRLEFLHFLWVHHCNTYVIHCHPEARFFRAEGPR